MNNCYMSASWAQRLRSEGMSYGMPSVLRRLFSCVSSPLPHHPHTQNICNTTCGRVSFTKRPLGQPLGVLPRNSVLTLPTWRRCQIPPPVEGSVLQDGSSPTSEARYQSRLSPVLLTGSSDLLPGFNELAGLALRTQEDT